MFAVEATDRFSPLLDRLKDMIDPDFGLLDYLRYDGLISDNDHEKIEKMRYVTTVTVTERVGLMLELIKRNIHSTKFLNALSETRQKHVVNYIQSDGRKEFLLSCSSK